MGSCTVYFALLPLAIYGFLVALVSFGLGISEAYFVSQYNNLKGECENLWELMLFASIINIWTPLLTACGIHNVKQIFDSEASEPMEAKFWRLTSLALAIWCVVVYSGISNSCQEFWQENANELWIFLSIHYVAFWIALGWIGWTILVWILDTCVCGGPPTLTPTPLEV